MKYNRTAFWEILNSSIGMSITGLNFDVDQIINNTHAEKIIYETSVTGLIIHFNSGVNWLIDSTDYSNGMDYLGIDINNNFRILEPNIIDQTSNKYLVDLFGKQIVSIEIIENHYSREIDLPFALKFKFDDFSVMFVACAELNASSKESTYENIARSRDSLILVFSEADAKWLSITTDFNFKDE